MQNPHNSVSYIIGIGASAGGLEAITGLFENMPDNTGFSFVVVQHISPDHNSLMAELLSRHTTMPTMEAEEGMMLEPNSIYIIPSRKFMTVKMGKLHLHEKVKSKLPNNAIDVFFESLAEESRDKAVGIILSGTGSDGTKGLAAIKKCGGIVMVQDPLTAAFDGMPNSAIAPGNADLVSSPEMMAEQLLDLLKTSPALKLLYHQNEKSEAALRDILVKVREATAVDFSHYKRPTLLRRLAKRMSELNITDINVYHKYLDEQPEEMQVISKEFLINVSSFFRDKEAFEKIQHHVIPAIMKNKQADDTVKIWSVACSTGEEPYTLAMLFREYLAQHKLNQITIKIFASDIDRDALDTASRGVYNRSIVQDVSPERLKKHFVQEGNSYRIHPDIRKMVVFSYHDILKHPPYSRMDLVTCRNMLIYINHLQQQEILRKLHFALNLDAYLFLGVSETAPSLKNFTQEVDRKWKIYKCLVKGSLMDKDSTFPVGSRSSAYLPADTVSKAKNGLQHIPDLFNQTILEENNFAGVFIDTDFDVKQATGTYKRFLNFPESGFNFNLLKLVSPELSLILSISIRNAIKTNQKVVVKDVAVNENGKTRHISVIVKPYLQQHEYAQPFIFIVLSESSPGNLATPAYTLVPDDLKAEPYIAALEKELSDTRANLQNLIEEIETANEELQSTNEEMLSTNEELQSTNEELQSLNEELHTVSAEHQQKIKELTELNDDLNNYFTNSSTGQILVDKKLIIRKFTPATTRMVNLIQSDLNRSIVDITTQIRDYNLVDDIKKVMRTQQGIEKEIVLNDNTVHLVRISPFKRGNNSIDGVVINFIDISEVKKLASMVEAILDSSTSGIGAQRAIRNKKGEVTGFEFITANTSLETILGYAPGTLVGQQVSPTSNSWEGVRFESLLKVYETAKSDEYDFYDKANDKWFEIQVAKIIDGVVTNITDITEKRKAAEKISASYEALKVTSGKLIQSNTQLERSNMDLMQFASVASHDLKEPLRKIETFGNMLYAKMKGRAGDGEMNYLEKIIRSSHRMQRLIEDVLTLSKLSNQEIAHSRVDLNKTLQRIIEDLEITIDEKKAKIEISKLPVITAVEGQMHQLFQNLISNALKFNDKKTPAITIKLKPLPQKLQEKLEPDTDKYHVISVKDNGIGFEDEFREKIFGIFQRLNGNQFDGTGIGLAISRKITDNHHGYLLADSEPGKGTEFFILLPK